MRGCKTLCWIARHLIVPCSATASKLDSASILITIHFQLYTIISYDSLRSQIPEDRDAFGSTTPSHTVFSPELRGQKSSPSPDRLLFSRRDVGTVTEPAAKVAPRPSRRHWQETPDRWDRRLRRYYSSEEELNSEEEKEVELLNKRRTRIRQEPLQGGRRERKLHQTPNRCLIILD